MGDEGCTLALLMPCALVPFALSTESPLCLEEGGCIQQTKAGAETFPFPSSPLSLLACRKFLNLQGQGEIGEVDGKGLLNREKPHPAQEVPELRKAEAGEILGEVSSPIPILTSLLWHLRLAAAGY